MPKATRSNITDITGVAAITAAFADRARERQAAKVVPLHPKPSLADMADTYGDLHDQIKALEKQAEEIKAALKASGQIEVCGSRYRVAVTFRAGAERVDTKKTLAHFGRDALAKLGLIAQGAAQTVLNVEPVQAASVVLAIAAE